MNFNREFTLSNKVNFFRKINSPKITKRLVKRNKLFKRNKLH